jgi:hypothetical protein
LNFVSFSLIGTARMEGMVVDDEDYDAAAELILKTKQRFAGCRR